MTKIKDITDYLEGLAPLSSQESYDNCGLIVGDKNAAVSSVLVALDCIEKVVDEAISLGANLIVAHHPIVFSGLKKITGNSYIERVLLKAIKNDIAIYAIHTNFDNYRYGVNDEIASRLRLKDVRILRPKKGVLKKVICFVPEPNFQAVLNAMHEAGGGEIGNYSEVSFQSEGTGQFTPSPSANPYLGKVNERETVQEMKIEMVVSAHRLSSVVSAMLSSHPYEEVAYDIFNLENTNNYEGAGMVGDLESPVPIDAFFHQVKDTFNCGVIRHTEITKKEIKRIAFCGGSGSFLLNDAIHEGADVFITGDFKYHEFFDADSRVIIADIGHFESEQFTSYRIKRELTKKFTKFAIHLTEVNTNPINYF